MKKKFLSLALVLAMALTLLPTVAFAEAGDTEQDPITVNVKGATITTAAQKTGTDSKKEAAVSVEWSISALTKTDDGAVEVPQDATLANAISKATVKVGSFSADASEKTGETTDVTTTNLTTGTVAASVAITGAIVRLPADTGKWYKFVFEDSAETSVNYEQPAATTPPSITSVKGEFTDAKNVKATVAIANAVQGTTKVNVILKKGTTTVETLSNRDVATSYTFAALSADADPSDKYTVTVEIVGANPAVTMTSPEFQYTSSSTSGNATIAAKAIGKPTATTATLTVTVSNYTQSLTLTATLIAADKTEKTATQTVTANGDVTFTFNNVPDGSYTYKVEGAGATTLTVSTPANLVYHAEIPVTPTTPETPKEDNTPPSNNSQGIPVASEVSTPTQANQAINTLKNTNANTLQERLMTNDTAASSFASLEDAVKRAKGISVSVDVATSSAPSAVRSGVGVTGAAFNASGSSVRLVVNAPSKSYSASTGYQISMTLTGVSNPAKLAVPVIITLPLPSDVRADRLVVLHYHDGSSTPTTIVPAVSGSSLRFTVTGFSDFVVTDQESAGNNGVSQAFTTVQGGNRNDGTLDDATLASIAAMLSGDGVFVDVPSTHWAAKEIRWARDGGLMSGYGNGSFGPTASTTRQQLWMVLARLSGTRPSDMAMARQWAINTGVSDGSNPTGVLSRQQLVTMLYRFAKSQGKDVSASAKLSGYTDSAKVASYAKEALSWAAAKGIMSGSNGKLNPEGTATRAHFAVFLYRYSNG